MRHFTGSVVAGGRGEKEQEERSSGDGVSQTKWLQTSSADNVFSRTIANDARCNGSGRKGLATEGRILYVSDVALVFGAS